MQYNLVREIASAFIYTKSETNLALKHTYAWSENLSYGVTYSRPPYCTTADATESTRQPLTVC